jgi:signal transduction histidine kinase
MYNALPIPSVEPSGPPPQRQTAQSIIDAHAQAKRAELDLRAQSQMAALEVREKEASVRRMELENMKLELELAAMRKRLQE